MNAIKYLKHYANLLESQGKLTIAEGILEAVDEIVAHEDKLDGLNVALDYENKALRARVKDLEAYNDEHQSLAGLQDMAIARLLTSQDRLLRACKQARLVINEQIFFETDKMLADAIANAEGE